MFIKELVDILGEVVFNISSNTTPYGTLHTLPIHPTTLHITNKYLSTLHLITCSPTTLSTNITTDSNAITNIMLLC